MDKKITVKESMILGSIANFFGVRFGNYNIGRILSSLGLLDVPEGNKTERIAHVLRLFYKSDPDMFAQFLNVLLKNHRLNENDLSELRSFINKLGFELQEDHVISLVTKEEIYTEPRPFDAFRVIEKIIRSGKNRIGIIDPYVDESLFILYLGDTPPEINIKIITTNMYDKFREVARKFRKQRPRFEVRLSKEIHDRYIIVDNKAWTIGQSIKDAGNKPLTLIMLDDTSKALELFEKLWTESKRFI